MSKVFLILSLLAGALCAIAPAADLLVPEQYSTIQGAINAASDGDTITVRPGTYRETLSLGGKNVILQSTDPMDWDVVEATVINGDGSSTAVTFSGTETSACVVRGFTITGGGYGGVVGNNCDATVSNCIITGNTKDGPGAGIHGVGMLGGAGAIRNCIIRGNSGWSAGGLAACHGLIVNCLIADNTGLYRGGIANCDGQVINCTIVNNTATTPGDTNTGSVYHCDGPYSSITNCIIWGNSPAEIIASTTPTYSCIENWTGGGTGNISSDPRFEGAWGIHLGPGSPCIDAGTDAYYTVGDVDIDGEGRKSGLHVDIGADEMSWLRVHNIGPMGGPAKDIWYESIQEAIDSASEGDVLVANPATYRENVALGGKNVVLRSLNPDDWDIVKATIILGDGASTVVTFSGSETSSCVLSGFTITNGGNGGIIGNYCDATVSNCIITGNTKDGPGAGIHGLGMLGGAGAIRNCIIRGNSGWSAGGLAACHGLIVNCLIADNTGLYRGGIANCDGQVINCTIANNTATTPGATCVGGVYACDGPYSSITNCIIWGNSPGQILDSTVPSYSCIEGWSGGEPTNIGEDPNFVNLEDVQYLIWWNSPCVDAGGVPGGATLPATDINGNERVADGNCDGTAVVDMGCYEFWGDLDPSAPDNDGDGLSDWWEYLHGLDPDVSNSDADTDSDGVLDTREYQYLTNPISADSDGDGFSDGVEIYTFGTDPLKRNLDEDKDGIPDEVDPDPDTAATGPAPVITDVQISVNDESVTVTVTASGADEVMIDGMYVEGSSGTYEYTTDLVTGAHEIIIRAVGSDGIAVSSVSTVTVGTDGGTYDTAGAVPIAVLNVPAEGLTVSTGSAILEEFERRRVFLLDVYINDGSTDAKVVVSHTGLDFKQTIYYPKLDTTTQVPPEGRLVLDSVTREFPIKLWPGENTIDIFTRHNHKRRKITLKMPPNRLSAQTACLASGPLTLRATLALPGENRTLRHLFSGHAVTDGGPVEARVSAKVNGGYWAFGGSADGTAFNIRCYINGHWMCTRTGSNNYDGQEVALYHIISPNLWFDYSLTGSNGTIGGRDIKRHGEEADFRHLRRIIDDFTGRAYVPYRVRTEVNDLFPFFDTIFFPFGRALDICFWDKDSRGTGEERAPANNPWGGPAGVYRPAPGRSDIYDYGNYYGSNFAIHTFAVDLGRLDIVDGYPDIGALAEDFIYPGTNMAYPGFVLTAPVPPALEGTRKTLYLTIYRVSDGVLRYLNGGAITALIKLDYDSSKMTVYNASGAAITPGQWVSAYDSLYGFDPSYGDNQVTLKVAALTQISQSEPEVIAVQLKIHGGQGVFEVGTSDDASDAGEVVVDDKIFVATQ